VYEINFAEGEKYITDNNMTIHNKIQVTNVLTKLIVLPKSEHDKTYKVVPTILAQFAEGARIHTGYCLLKRCICHATNPRGKDIRDSKVFLFEEQDKIGLVINHQIKVSMNKNTYNVKVAFTASAIIACRCDCKSRSSGTEQIICVHILPVLFQASLYIIKGMNENMLVEIANHIPTNLVQQYETLQTTIKILVMEPFNNVEQILNHYLVGREQMKKKYALLASLANTVPEYGPLWHLDMRSSLMKAKAIQKQNTVSENIQQNIISTDEITIQNVTDRYRNICDTIAAMVWTFWDSNVECFCELIGFCLLLFHSKREAIFDWPTYQKKREWKQATELANVFEREKEDQNWEVLIQKKQQQ
jgi:hypothetical protein